MSSLRFLLACFVAVALIGVATDASAQGWLEDRSRAEGPGFRLGNLELHPGFGAEVGYDSNIFLSSSTDTATGTVPDVDPVRNGAILRFTPHLFLSTLGPQRSGGVRPTVDFRTGASASLYHYASDSEGRIDQTNVEVNTDVLLTVLPGRPFSFTVLGDYSRTIRPFTEAGAVNQNYNRNRVNAGAKVNLASRGGIVKGSGGYQVGLDVFEGTSFSFADSITHHGMAEFSWRFLPSTALLYDADYFFTDYTSSAQATVLLSNSHRVRSRIGFNGAITKVLSILAMGGYGVGFFDVGDDYDSFVAQVQLTLALTRSLSFKLGYDRDFDRSFIGGFFRRDRGSAEVELMISGAWLVALSGGVGYYDFGRTFDPTGLQTVGNSFDRSDVRADAVLFTEYRIADWLALNARFQYMGNFTDYRFQTITTVLDPADFNRFTVWGGARVFY